MSKQDLSQHLTQDVIHEYTPWMRKAVEYLIRGAIFAIVFYFLYRMSSQSATGAVEKASRVNFSSMRYRLLTLRAFWALGICAFSMPRQRRTDLANENASSPRRPLAPIK